MAAISKLVSETPKSEDLGLRLIDVKARWRYRLLRAILFPIARMLFRIEVRGRSNIPPGGGFIVAANHLNWLDSVLLLIAFPIVPRLNFVADATFVTESHLLWFVTRQIGGVLPLIKHGHGGMAAARVVRACLDQGGLVGFYPEGRYEEKETAVLPFHHGFAWAAVTTGAQVVPAAISGAKDLWFRKRVVVEIGKPISPRGHTLESLADVTRGRIIAMCHPEAPSHGPRLFRRWLSRLFA
jgi:1-acyl-sn-glycerol-3-phosphate acyltransferase